MAPQEASLQVGQDLEFQRREWGVQRAAWVVGVLLVAAGVLGLFGGGPLSHAQTGAGPMTVEYERLVRKRAPTELVIRIDPATTRDGQVAVWIESAYLDKVEVERVLPEPLASEAGGDRLVYRFAVPGDTQTPAEVTFSLQPDEPGGVSARIGVGDDAAVTFSQFIYP